MADIKITEAEIEAVAENVNSQQKSKSKNKKVIIGICITVALLLILCIVGVATASSKPAEKVFTVKDFRVRVEHELNEELKSPNHPIRKRTENAHVTVDVRMAYVSDIQVVTKDGSNNVGKVGENIRRMSIDITTIWDGFFRKDGKTVFHIEWQNVNGEFKVTQDKIAQTDAIYNAEDPESCWDLGFNIGLLLSLLL